MRSYRAIRRSLLVGALALGLGALGVAPAPGAKPRDRRAAVVGTGGLWTHAPLSQRCRPASCRLAAPADDLPRLPLRGGGVLTIRLPVAIRGVSATVVSSAGDHADGHGLERIGGSRPRRTWRFRLPRRLTHDPTFIAVYGTRRGWQYEYFAGAREG